MSHDPYDSLQVQFPRVYKRKIYFQCLEGWYRILFDLSVKLDKLVEKEDEIIEEPMDPFEVTQVKEKYGTLRFYTNWSTAEMDKAIVEAEDLSAVTCELTGNPGKLISKNGWYMVRDPNLPSSKNLTDNVHNDQ